MTLAGLIRHLNEQSAHKEIRVYDEENQNPCDKTSLRVENISTENNKTLSLPQTCHKRHKCHQNRCYRSFGFSTMSTIL